MQTPDLRRFAPATERNRQPIFEVLRRVLPATGTVLEIASLDKGIAKARAEAVEAARARRTLEILRERRLAAFNELESRREQTALDEIAANGARTAARHADAGSLA